MHRLFYLCTLDKYFLKGGKLMPSVKALEHKQGIISEIKDRVNDAKSLVLFDYRGLTDKEIKALRNKLRENDSEYKVYKNTLLKLAFKDLKLDFDEFLTGPTAIAFSKDDVAAIKVLSDVSKKNDALVLKAGYVENLVCDKDKLAEFAKIPSREGLYTMLAGGMIEIVKNLSIALNLYAEQKEGTAEAKEEPISEVKEEATVEEKTAEVEEAKEEQTEEEVTTEDVAEEQAESVEEETEETASDESADNKEGE